MLSWRAGHRRQRGRRSPPSQGLQGRVAKTTVAPQYRPLAYNQGGGGRRSRSRPLISPGTGLAFCCSSLTVRRQGRRSSAVQKPVGAAGTRHHDQPPTSASRRRQNRRSRRRRNESLTDLPLVCPTSGSFSRSSSSQRLDLSVLNAEGVTDSRNGDNTDMSASSPCRPQESENWLTLTLSPKTG